MSEGEEESGPLHEGSDIPDDRQQTKMNALINLPKLFSNLLFCILFDIFEVDIGIAI